MACVNHPGKIRIAHIFILHSLNQFTEYQKKLIRLDGAGGKIIVTVHGSVEVKTSQTPEHHQPADNLFNICIRQMMSQINQYLGTVSYTLTKAVGSSPVGNNHGIKMWLI